MLTADEFRSLMAEAAKNAMVKFGGPAEFLMDRYDTPEKKAKYAKDLFEAYFVNNMLLADKYCSDATSARRRVSMCAAE